ncbi:MAG: hypothetical protein Q9160_005845 [Pyrenula sp. 1 TL-2023]
MSPNSMLPPPTTYAHRRTKINTFIELPPSPPSSPESSACLPYPKMSLSKGATFHVPSSPPAEDDPVLSIRHLPQRSATSSHSLLDLILDKEADAATKSIAAFEHQFSHSGHRQSTTTSSISVDEVQKSQQRRLSAQFSDSGLGSSIASDSVKDFNGFQEKLNVQTQSTELDGRRQCQGLSNEFIDIAFIDAQSSDFTDPNVASVERPKLTPSQFTHKSRSAVTQSISPIKSSSHLKPLSNSARRRINDHIFQPLLREDRFKFFHPLVKSLGHRSRNFITCLRDLERSLIFEPLVSAIYPALRLYTHSSLKKLPVSKLLYRSFGEFSVQLVLDTYLHLSEPEQRRAVDRPYDNGYFLDLVQQVGRLAAQVGSSRRGESNESSPDEMAFSPYDSPLRHSMILRSRSRSDDIVTLEGGISQTGDIAELVRWNKDGKGISLRTNKAYEALPGLKRQADEEFDEDAERAMARRKKNADPTPLQLKCCDSSCNKIFDRKCDLAKHEKTHTRPFKCPYKNCSYNEKGLPTEKEKERHVNDKHTKNPKLFSCKFCEFSTKRESNCKQHMEKKHGFVYERTKGKGKKMSSTPQQTPQTPSMDTPSTEAVDYSTSAGSAVGSVFPTPVEESLNDFGLTPSTPYDPMGDYSAVESGMFDPTNEYLNGSPFDFSAPMFAHSNKNESAFSSPAGMLSDNGAFTFGASEFTAQTGSNMADGMLRLDTQNHAQMSNIAPYRASSYIGGLPTPSASLPNLQPYSSNPSISGPSPVGPTTLHTFSPSMDSTGSAHNQATITPASNTFLHPSFSPVGQDHLLNDFAGDSQLDQMNNLPTTTAADAFDPNVGPNMIPDFDLYGDGTVNMELDMGQGNTDDEMALFGM